MLSTRRFVTDVVLRGEDGRRRTSDAERAFTERSDRLTRRALRALLFLAVYNDLPEQSRSHPDVQQWVERFSPELEQALSETSTLLASYPIDELALVETALRRDPSLLMQYCELLDGRSRDEGLGRPSRRFIRSVGRRLTNALRSSSLEAIVDECLLAFETVLDEVGRENDFSVIMRADDPSFVYKREALDITDLVIKTFNRTG